LEHEDILLRITKDINETFVGTFRNEKGVLPTYGPFKYNDLIYIENSIANNLIKQGYATKHGDYQEPLPPLSNNGGIAIEKDYSLEIEKNSLPSLPIDQEKIVGDYLIDNDKTIEDNINEPSKMLGSDKDVILVTTKQGTELKGRYIKDIDGKLIEINVKRYFYKFLSCVCVHHMHHMQVFPYLRPDLKIISRLKLKTNMHMLHILKIPDEFFVQDELFLVCIEKNRFFDRDPDTKKWEISVSKTAQFFRTFFNIVTFIDNNEMFWYREGIYWPHAENIIKEFCNMIFEEAKSNLYEEIVKKVSYLTFIERQNKQDISLICVENGIIDIDSFDFKIHSPNYLMFNKIPIIYDPNAKCPKITNFFKDVFDSEDVNIAFEIFGYSLYRRYFIHKAIMLTGTS